MRLQEQTPIYMCLKEIKLYVQNSITILGSIAKIMGTLGDFMTVELHRESSL